MISILLSICETSSALERAELIVLFLWNENSFISTRRLCKKARNHRKNGIRRRQHANFCIDMLPASVKYKKIRPMKLTKSTLILFACCCLSILFTGCASIMCGSEQKVSLDSRPRGAEVLIYDSRGEIVFQ